MPRVETSSTIFELKQVDVLVYWTFVSMTVRYQICILLLQVEKFVEDWNGRGVRLESPHKDDGGREAAERGRNQRRSSAQKRTQVSTPLFIVAVF